MIVLASASPRRQELLRNAGIRFTVQLANIDETPLPSEAPRDCAERLAREKALTVHRRMPQSYILGADTIVVVDDEMLGKPRDREDVARMLRLLSGRKHEVITGVCVASPIVGQSESPGTGNPELRTASALTLVTMSEISDDEICVYAASGEPMDKAGGYAIQGLASRWIPRIEGEYSNVMGLPVALVFAMLKKQGAI